MSTIYVDKAVASCAVGPGPLPSPIPVTRGNPQHGSLCLMKGCSAPPGASVHYLIFSSCPMSQVPFEDDKPEMKHEPHSVRPLSLSSSKNYYGLLLYYCMLQCNNGFNKYFPGAPCGLGTELGTGCSVVRRTGQGPALRELTTQWSSIQRLYSNMWTING